jgi:hypothetical protein
MENDGRLILTGIITDFSIWDDTFVRCKVPWPI